MCRECQPAYDNTIDDGHVMYLQNSAEVALSSSAGLKHVIGPTLSELSSFIFCMHSSVGERHLARKVAGQQGS